jgi:hypothetical protein
VILRDVESSKREVSASVLNDPYVRAIAIVINVTLISLTAWPELVYRVENSLAVCGEGFKDVVGGLGS